MCRCPLDRTSADCTELSLPACAHGDFTLLPKPFLARGYREVRRRPGFRRRHNWLGAIPCECLIQAAALFALCPMKSTQGGLDSEACTLPLICAQSPANLSDVIERPDVLIWRHAQMAWVTEPMREVLPGARFIPPTLRLTRAPLTASTFRKLRARPVRPAACGPSSCSGRGTCEQLASAESTSFRCRCFPGYALESTESDQTCVPHVPRDVLSVSAAGDALPRAAWPAKRFGFEFPQPCPNACRLRGTCDGLGFCRCIAGWWGLDCAVRLDPRSGRPVHEGALRAVGVRKAEGAPPNASSWSHVYTMAPPRAAVAVEEGEAHEPTVRIYFYPLRPELRWFSAHAYHRLSWALFERALGSASVAPTAEEADFFWIGGALHPPWGGMVARFGAVLAEWGWAVRAAVARRTPNQIVVVEGDRAWGDSQWLGATSALLQGGHDRGARLARWYGVPAEFDPSNRSRVLVALQYNGRSDALADGSCHVCFTRGVDVMLPPLPTQADGRLDCAAVRAHSPLAQCAGAAEPRACARAALRGRPVWPAPGTTLLHFAGKLHRLGGALPPDDRRPHAQEAPASDGAASARVHTYLSAQSSRPSALYPINYRTLFYWLHRSGRPNSPPGMDVVASSLRGGGGGVFVPRELGMARATFCAVPPGADGGWGGRYVGAVVFGCIPVFIKPAPHADPLEEALDWRAAAVHAGTPEEVEALPRTLARLAANHTAVGAMRAALADIWPYLQYSSIHPGCTAAPDDGNPRVGVWATLIRVLDRRRQGWS